MTYTASDYYADLGTMRSTASAIGAGGVRKTVAAPNPYSFTTTRFQADFGLCILHFSMPDFYLLGIQVEPLMTVYSFYGSAFQIVNRTNKRMDFGESYAAMGWDKSNSSTTVTLDDVNKAFFELFGGVPSKTSFRSIVIAFAEGFRFNAIAMKVVRGTEIAGKELDWSAAGATVVQGP